MSHRKSKKRGIWWGGGGLRKATRESPDLSRNAKYRNQLSRLGIKKRVWNILLYIKFCSQQINWKPAPGGRYFDKLFGGEEALRPETNIICWYLFCKSICGLSWEIVERFVARNISQIFWGMRLYRRGSKVKWFLCFRLNGECQISNCKT